MQQAEHLDQQEKQFHRMTTAPIPGLVTSLGLPAVVGMLVTAVYNSADAYFVGKLGTSASGAVGIVFSLMTMIQAVGFTVGQGASSIVSRALGEKDYTRANETASLALWMALLVGGLLAAAGLVFLDPLMRLLGATDTMLPYARDYARYILLAAPVMSLSYVFNNLLRGEGKIKFAMIGITIGGLLNIGLDPLFIHTFGLGTGGAAIATAISQLVSMLFLLSAYFRPGYTVVRPRLQKITRLGGMLWDITKTGFPALLRQGLASVATIALNVSAVPYGDSAVAAMAIVTKIFMLIFSAALGIGQGYQPVAGYNYGAKLYGRVKSAFRFTLLLSVGVMTAASAAAFVFAPQIIRLFLATDPKVVEIGVRALRIQCCVMPTVPFVVVNNMTFQSVGKSLAASFLSAARQGIFFLIFISVLPRAFGLAGVQSAQAAADLCTFLCAVPLCILFFRRLGKEPAAGGGQRQGDML